MRILHAVMLFCLIAPSSLAQSPEYRLKAAFILNFAKFASWPEPEFSSTNKLVLCISGADPFAGELSSIDGKLVQGGMLQVKRGVKADELNQCHMVYVADQVAVTLQQVNDAPILTISDIPGFCQSGGMISLVTSSGKIQFEVNLDAVERNGLRLSAQVLKLAKRVYKRSGG